MKKILFISATFMLLTVAFMACKKSKDEVVPPPPPVDDAAALADFFERNVVPSQIFTIDNATGGTVTTTSGAKITFPPTVWTKNPRSANIAAVGPVTVEWKECVSKTDFVLSNKGTASNDLPLESGGTWMIKATQGTEVLNINAATPIRINLRRDSLVTGPMLLFNGNPAANKNGGAINWGAPRQADILPLSTPFSNFFCNLDSVGWGNADRFLSAPVYAANTKIVASNGADLINFSAMYVYKGRKIVWPMGGRSAGAVTDSHVAKNQVGHVVVFGFIKGVFTTGVLQDQTVTTDGQTFTVTLGTNTEAAFKSQLSGILL
jgi:hypothetical protein